MSKSSGSIRFNSFNSKVMIKGSACYLLKWAFTPDCYFFVSDWMN